MASLGKLASPGLLAEDGDKLTPSRYPRCQGQGKPFYARLTTMCSSPVPNTTFIPRRCPAIIY
jgi:hypothetical protein